MNTRFDPCAYEEEMLKDLAGMQRVRLQEYGGQWWEERNANLLSGLRRTVASLEGNFQELSLRDIEMKCADIANYAAMISADARRGPR